MRPIAACAMVVVESTRVSQVTPESPGIPGAMVLTVSFVLSPATGLSCHRRLRTCIRKLDTSVGVSGPHDFSVRLSALRPKAHPRPPHPAPRFVTLRNAPLLGQDGASCRFDLPDAESEIFLQTGLDRQNPQNKLICPSGGEERFVADDDSCMCGGRRASFLPLRSGALLSSTSPRSLRGEGARSSRPDHREPFVFGQHGDAVLPGLGEL
jgi:hypothetical protein